MASDVRRLTDEERARTRCWVAMLDQERATLRDEVEQDVAQYRNLTPERAAELRVGILQGAWRMLQQRPDRKAVLDHRDPPAPDFEKVWARLVAQYRAQRARRKDHSSF